jgi:hypothetical protein
MMVTRVFKIISRSFIIARRGKIPQPIQGSLQSCWLL